MRIAREKPLATSPSRIWCPASLAIFACGVVTAAATIGNRPASGEQPQTSNEPTSTEQITVSPPAALPIATPVAPAPDRPAPEKQSPGVVTIDLTQLALDEAKLRREHDALVQEIDSLKSVKEQWRGLKTILEHSPDAVATKNFHAAEGQVTLMDRVSVLEERDGGKWINTFELKPNGTLGKIIGSRCVGPADRHPDAGKMARVSVLEERDGGKWINTFELKPDGTMGKIIESRCVGPADKHSDAGNAEPAPKPVPIGMPAYSGSVAVPEPRAPAGPYIHQNGQQGHTYLTAEAPKRVAAPESKSLDLVSLATEYAYAVAEVQIAKAKLAEAQVATNNNQPGAASIQSLTVDLQAAHTKQQLLRRIVELAARQAQEDFSRLLKLHSAGAGMGGELAQAKTRVAILAQILIAGDGTDDTGERKVESKPEPGTTPPAQ